MHPENSGHVQNSGVLFRDNIAVQKFCSNVGDDPFF